MASPATCTARATHCRRPRFLQRRFRNRAWICECGQAWTCRWAGGYSGGYWQWEKWPREIGIVRDSLLIDKEITSS